MHKVNVRDAEEYIGWGSDFTASSITGFSGSTSDTGRLPEEWAEVYDRHAREGRIRYTVKSYATPIGWTVELGGRLVSVVPDVTYSTTTSRHQGATRRGFGDYVTRLSELPLV